MLAPHLVARVRNFIHFFAFVVDEPDYATSARERNIVEDLEAAHPACRHDAVQNCRVACPIEQPPAADGERLVAVIPDCDMLDSGLLVIGMDKGRDDSS